MGSKKHTGSQSEQDKCVVKKQFQDHAKFSKHQKSRVEQYLDLKGNMLQQRIEATLEWVPKIRERYAKKYPDLDVVQLWAEECSVPQITWDQLDSHFYLSLAVAIWMLDTLDKEMLLKQECLPYLKCVKGPKEAARMPKLYDSKYSNQVIEAMTTLIRCRNEKEKPFQSYLNETTAQYEKDREFVAVNGKDPSKMTNSDIFYTVFRMIPPDLAEKAAHRFQDKMWEFLDTVFENASIYRKRLQCVKRQQDQLHEEIREKNKKQVNGKGCPDLPWNSLQFDYERKQVLLKRQELSRLEDLYSKIGLKAIRVCQYAHSTFLMDRASLAGESSEEDADRLLSLQVEDPYELCFGFLYLVEKKSSLPWLYNAPMGVVMMALRRLPWMALNRKSGYAKGSESDKEEELVRLNMIPEPSDWTKKKEDFYRLRYEDALLYDTMPSAAGQWKLNLPQLMYGFSCELMPRHFYWFDDIKEAFVESGVAPGFADGLKYYLQAAVDCRYPIDFQREEVEKQETAPIPDRTETDAKIKELQTQLSEAKEKCELLQEQLTRQQTYQKQLEAEKKELREKMQEADIQHAEELKAQKEKNACLKRKSEQPREREKIADWAKKQFSDRLVLHPKAVGLLNDRSGRPVDVSLICDALDFLATDYWEQWQGNLTQEEVNRNCAEKYGRPFEINSTGENAIAYTRNQYTLQYTDPSTGKTKERTLDFHLKVGNSPETLLRIYFFQDKENKLIVVGSLPDHLKVVKMQ